MNRHVGSQVAFSGRSISTEATGIRFLSSVLPYMYSQASFLGGTEGTVSALEWSLSSVSSQMILEISSDISRILTEGALVHLSGCVALPNSCASTLPVRRSFTVQPYL